MRETYPLVHFFWTCYTGILNDVQDALKELNDKSISINETDARGRNGLIIAVGYGQTKVTKFLLDNNIEINTNYNCKHETTALHLSAYLGHEEIVKQLIEHKAQIDIIAEEKRTPLHLAEIYGHKNIVQYLMEHNAQQLKDIYGKTPMEYGYLRELPDLHYYSAKGDEKLVKMQIDKWSFNINDRDQLNQQTPLHVATIFGHIRIVEILIEKNANVHLTDEDGRTPLDLAKLYCQEDITKLLLEA